MGFLSALPAIWRALQCIRRYWDTRNVFPHLVNCGKYAMTILSAVFLSMYRMENNTAHRVLYMTFSALTSVYTSVWDIFMDFSLLQTNARHRLLRDITALKPIWVYYVIMAVDPVLRLSWIAYAIFTHDAQHSTIVSFLVAFAEVTRRASWAIFRVENEHCANVSQNKASRDIPLPYQYLLKETAPSMAHSRDEGVKKRSPSLTPLLDRPSIETALGVAHAQTGSMGSPAGSSRAPDAQDPGLLRPTMTGLSGASGHDQTRVTPRRVDSIADEAGLDADADAEASLSAQTPPRGCAGTRAHRGERRSILQIMSEAHKQDFEKRRPRARHMRHGKHRDVGGLPGDIDSDDDEDEEGEELAIHAGVEEEEAMRTASSTSCSMSGSRSAAAPSIQEPEDGAAVARVSAGEEATAAES